MRFLSEDKVVSDVEDYDRLLEFDADKITDYMAYFVILKNVFRCNMKHKKIIKF